MSTHSKATATLSAYGHEDGDTNRSHARRAGSGTLPGPVGETADLPILDAAVVAALVTLGTDTPGFLDERVGDFMDSYERHTGGMRRAVLHADAEGLIASAQALQGSCEIIGARRMAALSKKLEEAAYAGGARTLPLIIRLEMEYPALRAALEQSLTGAASSLPR